MVFVGTSKGAWYVAIKIGVVGDSYCVLLLQPILSLCRRFVLFRDSARKISKSGFGLFKNCFVSDGLIRLIIEDVIRKIRYGMYARTVIDYE
jgi:hypothetical protein